MLGTMKRRSFLARLATLCAVGPFARFAPKSPLAITPAMAKAISAPTPTMFPVLRQFHGAYEIDPITRKSTGRLKTFSVYESTAERKDA